MRPVGRFGMVLAVLLGLASGCAMTGYLTQAGLGQVALWRAARPLSSVVADPETSPRVRGLLVAVPRVVAFGAAHGLKATRHYRHYVELPGPAVCWVVSASAPLAFEPRVWSFPVVGSFPYLGWFDRMDAVAHAEALRAEGLDVDVRPVGAYSTLDFFSDPVLSSMIPEGPAAAGALANTILHESVHATLHLDGQGTFNESLASFVADALTPQFLRTEYGAASAEAAAWTEGEARGAVVLAGLRDVTARLEALYASPASDDDKRDTKWRLLAETRTRLGLRRGLNNAALQGYRTYASGLELFGALLTHCGGDHARLLSTLRRHSRTAFAGPQQQALEPVLRHVLAQPCGSL